VIYRSKGKFEKAEELYLTSLKIDPDFPEAYSSLVLIELNKKDFKKAVEYGEKAVKLNNSNGVIAANLSVAYHFNSNFNLRDKMFQKAKDLGYDKVDCEIVERVFSGEISLEKLLNNEP
jgi:tetratricopeptide (TPR) repeat protein